MKILFVDIEYDYGIKERGLNLIGQLGFKSSLERLGHEVIPFYYDDYLSKKSILQEKLLEKVFEVKPDLIFFMIFRDHFNVDTLDKLKESFLTVNWFGDDQWRFDDFTKIYAPHFSWCITTDKFSTLKYKKIGVKNVFRSQWAAIDSNPIPGSTGAYKYDVSFVGGAQPYRKWFVKELEKNGVKVDCFGFGWPNGPLSNEEMSELFAQSKINLNLSNSTSFDLRYLLSSPRNFISTMRSSKNVTQIKARNFEINYFGGFQLSDYAPSLEDYYTIGKEVVCYSSIDDALPLIRYYLENDGERESIRIAGHKKAVATHGYYHRLKEFFGACIK